MSQVAIKTMFILFFSVTAYSKGNLYHQIINKGGHIIVSPEEASEIDPTRIADRNYVTVDCAGSLTQPCRDLPFPAIVDDIHRDPEHRGETPIKEVICKSGNFFQCRNELASGHNVVVDRTMNHYDILSLIRTNSDKIKVLCEKVNLFNCRQYASEGARVIVTNNYTDNQIKSLIRYAQKPECVSVVSEGFLAEEMRSFAVFGANLMINDAYSFTDLRRTIGSLGRVNEFWVNPANLSEDETLRLAIFGARFDFRYLKQ